jgi:hypothetical protein
VITISSTPSVITWPLRGPGTHSVNLEVDYPISLKDHAPYAQHLNDIATRIPAPHVTIYHSPARPKCHARHENWIVTSHPMPHCLPLHKATNTMSTTEHPNSHTVSMSTPHPTPLLGCIHHLGPTNTQPKTKINTKGMANIPQPGT